MRDRKLRILDTFIAKELAGSFVFGVMSFTIILVAGDLLFDIADLIIEKGVSFWVVSRLFLYKLPSVITLTLPMACLLSSLLTFGRLSGNSELIALKSSGIAFQRILRPVLLVSVTVAIAALVFNETVVPVANMAADNLMRYEIAREKPSMLKERVFLREESGGDLHRVVYISSLRPRDGHMSDVLIQEFDEGKLNRISTARDGLWQDGKWILSNGEVFEVDDKGSVKLLFRFEQQTVDLDLTPGQIASASRDPEDMGIFELIEHIKILEKQGANVAPLWVTFHLRLAIPWASVVLALVGAAFGVRPQRTGAGLGFGMSILIVFAYYVVMSFCRALGQSGNLIPVISAWIPNIIFLVLGGFFAKRGNH